MNFWTPVDHPWAEGFDDKDMPWYLLYDYVEVYSWNEHENEFEFKWRDDFDDFNTNRWHKAEGGFEANSSTFCPDNVYTSHGKLVIKMEPEEEHLELAKLIEEDHEHHHVDIQHTHKHLMDDAEAWPRHSHEDGLE